MGIQEGPYTGKPNPHAWMSPSDALIYVDNIRDALSNTIPRMQRHTGRMRRPTKRRSRQLSRRSGDPGRYPRAAALAGDL